MTRPLLPALLLLLVACQGGTLEPKAVGPAADSGSAGGGNAGGSGDGADGGGTDSTDPGPDPEDAPSESIEGVAIRFEPGSALVEDAFSLGITGGLPGASLLVTNDGTDPRSSATAALWPIEEALPIEHSTVLRAVLVGDSGPVGEVITGTWIFPEQVAEQTRPEGWPDRWWTSYGTGGYNTASYELEPEIVLPDPDAVVSALRALPVVSMVMDPVDLWGSSGIYDHAWEEGEAWERPLSVSLLPNDGSEGFSIEGGVRVYGGASRYPEGTPKKSFRVVFRADYGDTHLDYPLYAGETEASRSDGFILRAGYNNAWTHWSPEQRLRGQLVHDAFARSNQRTTGWAASRGRFVHLFIDGLYWGVYDLTERPDAHFFVAHNGTDDFSRDPANWDVLNAGEAIDGDLMAWETTFAVARADDGSDAALEALRAEVDEDALIDYMLMNFWAGNTDWPYHNWYGGRLRSSDGRWRFASWDAEHTLEGETDNVTGVSDIGTPGELFATFARHPAFVDKLGARAAALLAEDGILGPTAAVSRYDALADMLAPAMLAESARWGSYRRDVYCYAEPPCLLYKVDEHWAPERERLTGTLIPGRAATLQAQIRAKGWWP